MNDSDKPQEIFDPGCEMATKYYDEISQIPEDKLDESHFALCLGIQMHKDHAKNHTVDCFVNRQVL